MHAVTIHCHPQHYLAVLIFVAIQIIATNHLSIILSYICACVCVRVCVPRNTTVNKFFTFFFPYFFFAFFTHYLMAKIFFSSWKNQFKKDFSQVNTFYLQDFFLLPWNRTSAKATICDRSSFLKVVVVFVEFVLVHCTTIFSIIHELWWGLNFYIFSLQLFWAVWWDNRSIPKVPLSLSLKNTHTHNTNNIFHYSYICTSFY